MLNSKAQVLDCLLFRFRDRSIPKIVIEHLAEYTYGTHLDKSMKEIDSILYLGSFISREECEKGVKEQPYVYDHCLSENAGTYYLFEFWLCPYE